MNVHASLKNRSPQMNSRIFKILQIPELLKLKKLLPLPKAEEKQQCCQTIKAINPKVSSMKTGT